MIQSYFLLALSIVFTVFAQLLFKKGLTALGGMNFSLANILSVVPNIFRNSYLLAGSVMFGVAFLIWFFVLSKIRLNVAYPISTSLNLSLVVITSWLFFKEQITVFQIIGIAVIIFGICLIFIKP